MNQDFDFAAQSGGGDFPVVGMIFVLAFAAFIIASMWKVFVKAGQPGWAAIVPIYNYYVMIKIVGRPTWWLALFFAGIIPFVGGIISLVAMIIISIDMAKSFGKGAGFGVGLALLSPVFYPILGFGSAQYVGPAAAGSAVAKA